MRLQGIVVLASDRRGSRSGPQAGGQVSGAVAYSRTRPTPVVCERDPKRTANANRQREQRWRGVQEVCKRTPLIVSTFVAFFTGKRELALDSSAHRSCCGQ